MKTNLKALKNKIAGEVLATKEHRNTALDEQTLRKINGGLLPVGHTVSNCPAADDSLD